MIDKIGLNNLAETLKRTGLACSAGEAMRMANDIAKTEKQVSKDFDRKNEEIRTNISNQRQAQGINDIIEKTSPEKKDFFIPVKGYSVEKKTVQQEVTKETEVSDKTVLADTQIPKTQTVQQATITNIPQQISQPEIKTEIKPDHTILTNKPETRQVYTDCLNDGRTLKEIMDEDAGKIYSTGDSPISGEKEVIDEVSQTIERPIQEAEPIKSPDTIEIPEMQTSSEPEKEKPKEIKNPIPKVNLMDHFNFSAR